MKINSLVNLIPNVKKTVSRMSKSNALLPVILLEIAVTGGRTYHAYQRDGFLEARERLTEESLGALFWFGGVKFFNKLGDSIGKKLLKLKEIGFDASKDHARNPMKNFIVKMIDSKQATDAKKFEKTLERFKFIKVLSSVLLANTVIGFVVPKMNQKITKKYQDSVENLGYKHSELLKKAKSMEDFSKKTGKDQKETSFKGGYNPISLMTVANLLENNNTCQLLSTDLGVAGGRAYNARNKHERVEVLFRDIASIYFYMFCRKNLDGLLNKIEDGRSTRLDPMGAEEVHKGITNYNEWKKLGEAERTSENFKKIMLGKYHDKPKDFALLDKVTKLLDKTEMNKNKKGDNLKTRIVDLEEFKAICPKEADIAQKMADLQPKLDGRPILTEAQVEDIFKGGMINDPDFLKDLYGQSLDGSSETSWEFVKTVKKWITKITGEKPPKPHKLTDPIKFVSEESLIELKGRAIDYINDIAKEAGKGTITEKLLETVKNKNFLKNTFNLTAGLVVSAYFLSTAIPKIQYWITEKQTGENKFPGTTQY